MSVFGQTLKSRFAVLGVCILLVLGGLFVQLWSMQVLMGRSYAHKAENNRVRRLTIAAPRGRIFDRKGRPLVVNRATLAVAVSPTVARNQVLLARLATLLGVPTADISRDINDARLEALQPRVVAYDVSQKVVAYLSEHSDEFPGVEVQQTPVREYPNGVLAAHVLGYVGEISDVEMDDSAMKGYAPGDIVGKAGVERQYERVLQGEKGFQLLEVDAQGRIRRVLDRQEPIPGRDIRLTIDIDTQRVAEKALQNAFTEAAHQGFKKARAGALVVKDVNDGDILALASAPTYDPRQFVGGITQKQWRSLNATASEFPLNDRAVMSAYAPASTFKVVTGLAALKEGFATASTDFECTGIWKFPGHEESNASWWTKKCWKAEGHGQIDFVQGVIDSCDTVFYNLGYRFWETGATKNAPGERLQAFARAAGFGARTGIDLPGEVAGRVPDAAWKKRINSVIAPEYAAWVTGDTVNMAIGQGDLLVTPLQLADVFSGVANGGKIVRSHVLAQIMASGGEAAALQTKPAVMHTLPTTPDQLRVMQDALLGVTTQGTAQGAFSGFAAQVGGKTGTAQVGSQAKDAKDKKDDYAVFGGYVPAEAPRYAIAVIVEQGGHGGSVAAPAAREVFGQLMGLPVVHVSAQDLSR